MKSYTVLFSLLILAAGTGCKKGAPANPVNPPTEKRWVVTTIAGNGEAGFANGPALSAKFHFPNDIAVAADGTLYVTDGDNFQIRKIAGGQVTTLAGGSFGIVNGNGPAAQFKFPTSIVVDGNGNIYTADARDPRIRKITPAGEVSTYAGADEEGFADGDADTARFKGENTLAADAQGNIYVTDAQNNRIRKISVSGKVSTIGGTGTAGLLNGSPEISQFNFPDGIAVDRRGNIDISDGSNFRIRQINSTGLVTVLSGAGKQGTVEGDGGIARFEFPNDMVADADGNLYVIDISRIRKITPQGVVSTIAGSTGGGYADGDGAVAKFDTPSGLGIDAQGNIYVADTNNNRIRKISSQ